MTTAKTIWTIGTFILLLTLTSCAKKSGITGVYNQHKRDADIALSVPKWLAMSVMPSEIKDDIKPLLSGMKQLKLLYDDGKGVNSKHLLEDFKKLSKTDDYTPYMAVTKEDTHLDILALESDGNIRELIFFVVEEETNFLLGVTGKINKENFLRELESLTSAN